VTDLRDNISPKTSLYGVPGFHDKNALKRLFTLYQIYVRIYPTQRLYAVCHGFLDTIAPKRLHTVCQIK